MAVAQFRDLEDAERASDRVSGEVDGVNVNALAVMNVDVVSATSQVLGVHERVLSFYERMAALPEFKRDAVKKLPDYALATWFLYVTNLPAPEPKDAELMIKEVADLRAKLLMWATPLVGAGIFQQVALDRIKEGAGNKDAPSDVVALVGLYRGKWEQVKNMCGVTEQDLVRGAEIAPAVFLLVSRRENQASMSKSEASLRVRKAFTLLDAAYEEARRGLQFLRHYEGDAEVIAPSLRRNPGPPRTAAAAAAAPEAAGIPGAPGAPSPAAAATPAAPTAPTIGGGGVPFGPPKS